MTETSRYLSILAKVMRNKNMHEENRNRDNFDQLYCLIHTEFNSCLQRSMYPYTSDIIQRTEAMLDEMEPLYLCNEIVGKQCLLVSCHITTNIFEICDSLIENKEYVSFFKKIYTQIPFVIVDTKNSDTIEIINYANIRISLSTKEFKFLVIESGKRKIALNKIIQFVIVNTKLRESNLCIIADNIYSNAEKLFFRALSGKLAYVDEEGIKTIGRRKIGKESSVLLSEEVYSNTINDKRVNKYKKVKFAEVEKFVKDNVQTVLYGFWEEYISIETRILNYYDLQLKQSTDTLKEFENDIIRVRIGDGNDKTLQDIRSSEEKRKEKFKSEKESIVKILGNIEELMNKICSELGETSSTEKKISRKIFEDMFSVLFQCKSFSSGLGKEILSRLERYGYDGYKLVTTYTQSMERSMKEVVVNFEPVEIELFEWEKAKMLIAVLNPEDIPVHKLELYIKALGEYCYTGKELYAKALVASGNQMQELLQESLRKGYEKAGSKLLEMYKNYHYEVNLQTLANFLVPEACMILADKNIKRCKSRSHFADLTGQEFTYYKIAAAKNYFPAIGKIVDVVFESRFSSGFQISANELEDSKYEKMIEHGHVICKLCKYLIDKMYDAEHYREILGIVLFCLNEDLSGAMGCLSNSDSAIALYCKGNMYEFGRGVAVDLNEAIKNYKSSLQKEWEYSQKVEKRLAACQGKKTRDEDERKSEDYYQSNRSYHSTSTYMGSSTVDDGCFAPNTKILMADGSYCEVEKIRVNDRVWVYDHYTGKLCCDRIIANVHENSDEIEFDIIKLDFGDNGMLAIVKSHALFDLDDNQYVWIDKNNVWKYVGHCFAYFSNEKICSVMLTNYSIERKKTRYYMPISRFHLNVFAEGILAMPPTQITVNMFKCKENMSYDMSGVERHGLTAYDDIKQFVTMEEYECLPCKYLKAICNTNALSIEDFMLAINLYREQEKYRH